jgi:hypothetical protein
MSVLRTLAVSVIINNKWMLVLENLVLQNIKKNTKHLKEREQLLATCSIEGKYVDVFRSEDENTVDGFSVYNSDGLISVSTNGDGNVWVVIIFPNGNEYRNYLDVMPNNIRRDVYAATLLSQACIEQTLLS